MKLSCSEAEKKAIAALTRPQPSFAAFRAACAEEERDHQEEIIRNTPPGQMVEGQGIFLGQWRPYDHVWEKSLGKVFNVFAAPQDLTDAAGEKSAQLLNYYDTVKRVAELKAWNGFDGFACGDYMADISLIRALEEGSYNGEWVIPPLELLIGMDNNHMQSDRTLYDLHNKNDLKGSFSTAAVKNNFGVNRYWSCTGSSGYKGAVSFADGEADSYVQDFRRMKCRPVRLVECKAGSGALHKGLKP